MKRQQQNILFKKTCLFFSIFVSSHFTKKLTCNRALKLINNVNLFGLSLCATRLWVILLLSWWDYMIHNENETSVRHSHMDKTFGNRLDLNGASAFKAILNSHCVLFGWSLLFFFRTILICHLQYGNSVQFFFFLFICINFTSCYCSAFSLEILM